MRTYALYNKDKRILSLILVVFVTAGCISIVSDCTTRSILPLISSGARVKWSMLGGQSFADYSKPPLWAFAFCDLSLSDQQYVPLLSSVRFLS